jgi:hypothetical protein
MDRERRHQLEQNRRQLERFRHEFSGEWLEI